MFSLIALLMLVYVYTVMTGCHWNIYHQTEIEMFGRREDKPENWRNSPDMLPYLWTACSSAFFTVDPLIWTKSKVPPNGKTVRISSIVMEPKYEAKSHHIITRTASFQLAHGGFCGEKKHWCTIFVALVYSCPYGPTIQHTYAHMIPLQLTWILDVVVNLMMQI